MIRRIGLIACGLVLVAVAGTGAQQVFRGTVMRVDPDAAVIIFDDGRMVQTTLDSTIISGTDGVTLQTLAPGTVIIVESAQPVAFRDGRYVVIGESAPVAVGPPAAVVVRPLGPPPVVIASPAILTTEPPPSPGVVLQTESPASDVEAP